MRSEVVPMFYSEGLIEGTYTYPNLIQTNLWGVKKPHLLFFEELSFQIIFLFFHLLLMPLFICLQIALICEKISWPSLILFLPEQVSKQLQSIQLIQSCSFLEKWPVLINTCWDFQILNSILKGFKYWFTW